ncbi:hypothetical protein Bca52824_068387 [Brassica carinata]|uniref:Uncharacterized protein n=1 Tax=Brassica carinata TaxID=52824 RepID=A0A8X7Q1R3_BRACI|nr:hypothetical protein Bca52824_068387 [Brassica carinata]
MMLLKVTLLSLGSAEVPLLDIVAYGGYAFSGLCLVGFAKIMWGYSYYALMPWTCLWCFLGEDDETCSVC